MWLQLALVQFFFNWVWNSAEEDHEIPAEHRVAEGLGQTDFEKSRKNQGFGIDWWPVHHSRHDMPHLGRKTGLPTFRRCFASPGRHDIDCRLEDPILVFFASVWQIWLPWQHALCRGSIDEDAYFLFGTTWWLRDRTRWGLFFEDIWFLVDTFKCVKWKIELGTCIDIHVALQLNLQRFLNEEKLSCALQTWVCASRMTEFQPDLCDISCSSMCFIPACFPFRSHFSCQIWMQISSNTVWTNTETLKIYHDILNLRICNQTESQIHEASVHAIFVLLQFPETPSKSKKCFILDND